MTSLNSKLQLALLNRKKGRNLLEKGFTLVELMIVIVIVGVLSAVALPNFLNQTGKAKGTEAKSQISAVMKEASAFYQQGGEATVTQVMDGGVTCEAFGAPADAANGATSGPLFNYGCSLAGDDLTVTATANAIDSAITGNQIQMVIALDEGTITTTLAQTSKLFGGTKANAAN